MRPISARLGLALALVLWLAPTARAQRELAGAPRIKLALKRLNTLGAVLMIAAHPDDENTALLAYLTRGRHLRAAYLALTRGEGGQNLIGPEQGDLLGVIRTQELLAARRIDGAEQYFTRAIDFGYSKTADETLAQWGRQEILGDIVWLIRRFRPDVIVLRFSGSNRDGHGHHQSSAILGKEAFTIAADPQQFADQLRWVRPWQAKRLFWNVFSFRRGGFRDTDNIPGRLDLDPGEFNPLLGFSYGEIAGMSRSMHRSQGFGAPERKGALINSLVLIGGEPAQEDILDGVDTSWNRVPGGASVGELLARAEREFNPERPEQIVPLLLQARSRMAGLDDPWVEVKRKELDQTIALATGLWLDAAANRYAVVPGSVLDIQAEAINRSKFPLRLISVGWQPGEHLAVDTPLQYNQPVRRTLKWRVPPDQPYSQPYWLRHEKEMQRYRIDDPRLIGKPDTDPALTAVFRIRAGDQQIDFERPVIYRWVDRVLGERTRPLAITPPVSLAFAQTPVVFPDARPKQVEVQLTAQVAPVAGRVRLRLPPGWQATPPQDFQLAEPATQVVLNYEITPPPGHQQAAADAVAELNGLEVSTRLSLIDYPHIPLQVLSFPARARLVRTGARTLARSVGYVMGAGDEVPEALRQLGCNVTLLSSADLARADLSRFDAIVTGVRAYNVRRDLAANQQRLLQYVEQGGTLVVQYNVLPFRAVGGGEPDLPHNLGPYPLRISRARVSVEDVPVRFLDPDHPLLNAPNPITPADFDGWVQERGLYFPAEWDSRYQPLWEMSDPGEPPLQGATLFAPYGKGAYVLTCLSWFRQLPAGVPGAYRIFANLLSAARSNR